MTQTTARAFLALWNGIRHPDLQAEYETWHSFEHVPERVGLPGFIEARRYRRVNDPTHDGDHGPVGYFTCYWITSLGALATPEYRDVFTNPTPWSARMRIELRDFFRMPCEPGGAWGNSSASQLATLHLSSNIATFGAQLDARLKPLVDRADLVCAHWGTGRPSNDFPVANSTGPIRGAVSQTADTTPETAHDFVVMLQHLDLKSLRTVTLDLLHSLGSLATPINAPAYFELLTQVRQDELTSPLTTRQPARPELLTAFTSKPGDTR